MKMSISTVVATGLTLFLVGAILNPALARSFSPEPGVRCNASARVCYVRGAPSIRMTQAYFGERAAHQLRRDLRRHYERRSGPGPGPGPGPRGHSQRLFYPEPGVRCDRFQEVCYDRWGRPNYHWTRQYLGPRAARNLRRW
jgi:hypothetical protein